MSLIKKKIKKTHIAGIAIASLFSIALIVGDCFAYKYSDIISTFLGVAEQLTGNDQSIEESAKTADGVVRKIADEGVVLLKNKENNGKQLYHYKLKTSMSLDGARPTADSF